MACMVLAGCGRIGHDQAGEGAWKERPARYARCFQVFERGADRQVIVFGSATHGDTLAVLILGPGGQSLPERLAVMSTTHLPFIEAIGRQEKVIAAAMVGRSQGAYWQKRRSAGTLAELANADGVDRERLVEQRIDALFDYPFGRSQVRSRALGLLEVPVTEYMEEHPLGRAEWIRFFGTVLGAERIADSLFDGIVQRYYSRMHESQRNEAPKVFFGSAWQGSWHVPSGDSYMARLITDAGGSYAFADRAQNGNIAVSLEEVIAQGSQCQRFGAILAHGGEVSTLDMTGDARVAALPVLRNGAFYLDSERSDVFGAALLEPDVLLAELACVFRDTACDAAAHRYVFRPVQ